MTIKKFLSILLSLAIVFSTSLTLSASAFIEKAKYGENENISLDIVVDGSDYEWGDDIVFNATITNKSSQNIYYIDILSFAKHSDWFSLVNPSSEFDIEYLEPKQSKTVQVVFSSEKMSVLKKIFVLPFKMIFDALIPTTFNDTKYDDEESVKIGLFSFRFGFVLEYSNISVDLNQYIFDSMTGKYYLFDEVTSFNGIFVDSNEIKNFNYKITDQNDNELCSGDIDVEIEWETDDISFIVGENEVTFDLEYADGTTETQTITVHNLCENNMKNLELDMNDDDDDGVLNYIEELYNLNITDNDTDNDGLSDYDELAVLGSDPYLIDSDSDSITDNEEDSDNDELSDYDEIYTYYTDPILLDSDGDSVFDGEEVLIYKTSPTESDSDEDGADDGWEIRNDFDPNIADSDFDGKSLTDEFGIAEEEGVEVIAVIDDPYLDESTPGYMGISPYQITLGEVGETQISIPFDNTELSEEDVPVICYYDEEAQQFVEVPTTVTEDGCAVAEINKDGTYILLNKRYVVDVWENDIVPPSTQTEEGNGNMDIVFAIDRSASMDSNDPDRKRIEVVKQFIARMRPDDKAAIVQYTAIAETIMPLTEDKEALINAVDSIQNSDGGGCAGSDTNAGTNGAAAIRNSLDELNKSTAQYKYVIFLTDGDDNVTPEGYTYETLTGEAKDNKIVIHTVGLVGTGGVNVERLQQIADATDGNYYLATTGVEAENIPEDVRGIEEVYKDIENITIDRHTDSNSDGISDYYTKLICDGVLTTSKGTAVFGTATYEQVQENADFDGDGLINGEEVVIKSTDKGVYAKINSYPNKTDSDGDSISDYNETQIFTTSPLKANSFVDYNQVQYTTNDSNFASNLYLNVYNGNIFEALSVQIGNTFFGSTLDQTSIYQAELVNYFEQVTENEELITSLNNNKELVGASVDALFNAVAEGMQKTENEDEFWALLDLLNEFVDDTDDILECTEDSLKEGAKEVLKLITFNDKAKATYYADLAADYLKNQKDFVNANNWPHEKASAYLDRLSIKYFDAAEKSELLNQKITVKNNRFNKLLKGANVVGKVVDVAGTVFTIYDFGKSIYDSYMQFNRMMANLETMKNHIDFLDAIINMSDSSIYLRTAAQNLKSYLYNMYSNDVSAIDKALMEFDYAVPVLEKVVSEVFHSVISATPVGAVVELVRIFGNIAFDLEGLSKLAAQTVATSASASALSKYYINSIGYVDESGEIFCVNNARTTEKDKEIIVAFSDFSEKLCKYLADIAIMRQNSEVFMKEMNKGDEAIASMCDGNIEKCNNVIISADTQLLLYYKANC